MEVFTKEAEMDAEILGELLDELFKTCNFAVSEYQSVTQNEGEITVFSKELAIFMSQQENTNLQKLNPEELKKTIQSFLSTRPTAIVIDINNELKLYNTADHLQKEEIIIAKETAQEKPVTNTQEDPFKEQLQNTINLYEKLLIQQKNQGKDASNTESLLQSLNEQLKSYNEEKNGRGSKSGGAVRKKSISQQDIKDRALEEIFKFYSKQHTHANGKKTFDAMVEEQNQLILGYFSKLLKDYEIVVEQKVLFLNYENIIRK